MIRVHALDSSIWSGSLSLFTERCVFKHWKLIRVWKTQWKKPPSLLWLYRARPASCGIANETTAAHVAHRHAHKKKGTIWTSLRVKGRERAEEQQSDLLWVAGVNLNTAAPRDGETKLATSAADSVFTVYSLQAEIFFFVIGKHTDEWVYLLIALRRKKSLETEREQKSGISCARQ